MFQSTYIIRRPIRKEFVLYKPHHVHSSQYRSDTRTVNMSRCKLSLGSDSYIEVKEWKGELRVDLREWKDDKPTKKGINLTIMRWKNWVEHLEYANRGQRKRTIPVTSGETYIAPSQRVTRV